jgi:hypothetical protein
MQNRILDGSPVKKYQLFQLVIVFLLVTNFTQNNMGTPDIQSATVQDIVIGAVSYAVIPINCLAGDTLSGKMIITNDGDLFPGDQTKYDNWLLGGIDFLIFDADNYELWVNDLSANSLYERRSVLELSWSVEIPSEGTWYIVFVNDSIFIKQIQSDIQHDSPASMMFIISVVTLIALTSFCSPYLILKRKNE